MFDASLSIKSVRALEKLGVKVMTKSAVKKVTSDTIYLRYATSSPAVDAETGNVYVQGTQGLFSCFTRDGQLLWQHSLMEELGRLTFPNSRTASPRIDHELVITRGITSNWGANGAAGDRLYAFDKRTGELVWSSSPGERPQDNTFSQPLLTWLDGKRVLISAGGDSTIIGINARTGDPMFRFPAAKAGAKGGINAALVRHGLSPNSKVRVRRSWDPPDPDSQLSLSQTKAVMGEFDFNYAGLSASGWTAMSATWKAHYIPTRDTYPTGIRATCNIAIKADLRAALQEVVNTLPGLVGAHTGIDVTNTNSYGGCSAGAVRFARITQSLGSVSRHSWGQPIDMSTAANCQGCVPKMDCRIVHIFRKHGFAWGGNFLTPDGMHFEWVGEPRNTLQYPSKYCPNPTIKSRSLGSGATQRDSLFSDDGFMDE
jgi:hypothetical protein